MILRVILKVFKIIYRISKKFFVLNIIIAILSGVSGYLLIYSNKILLNSLQNYSVNEDFNNLKNSTVTYLIVNLIIIAIKFLKNNFFTMQRGIVQCELDIMTTFKNGSLTLENFEESETYSLIQESNKLGKDKVIDVYVSVLNILEMVVSIILGIKIIINSSLSWQLSLIFIFPIIKLIFDMYIARINYNKEKNQIDRYRKISYINYLTANDIAKKELINYNFFNYWFNKFKIIRYSLVKDDFKVLKKTNLLSLILSFFETIIYIAIIFIVIVKKVVDSLIGDIFAFIDAIMMIQNNTTILLSYFSDIYRDSLYAENFFKFIDKEIDFEVEEPFNEEINNIEIKKLKYSYPDGKFNLFIDKLNIEKGQPVVILGSNGSGKSTLIKLIGKLYNKYSGCIEINNSKDLKKLNTRDYNKHLSILFQDYNKYEATVRENVATEMCEVVNDFRLDEYMNMIDMKSDVDKLEKKYDTILGNWFGNTKFSGGQWQRIAIARCLIKDSEVLILDEPLASVDAEFEKTLFRLLREVSKEKILIVITHKLTNDLLSLNPKVVLLNKGKIVEQGNLDDINQKIINKYLLINKYSRN